MKRLNFTLLLFFSIFLFVFLAAPILAADNNTNSPVMPTPKERAEEQLGGAGKKAGFAPVGEEEPKDVLFSVIMRTIKVVLGFVGAIFLGLLKKV